METVTLATIISAAGSIVTAGLSWLGSTVTTIVNNPLLELFALLGLIGTGIGLYRRLAG